MTRNLILVVEDNEANQLLVAAVLELEGFTAPDSSQSKLVPSASRETTSL